MCCFKSGEESLHTGQKETREKIQTYLHKTRAQIHLHYWAKCCCTTIEKQRPIKSNRNHNFFFRLISSSISNIFYFLRWTTISSVFVCETSCLLIFEHCWSKYDKGFTNEKVIYESVFVVVIFFCQIFALLVSLKIFHGFKWKRSWSLFKTVPFKRIPCSLIFKIHILYGNCISSISFCVAILFKIKYDFTVAHNIKWYCYFTVSLYTHSIVCSMRVDNSRFPSSSFYSFYIFIM